MINNLNINASGDSDAIYIRANNNIINNTQVYSTGNQEALYVGYSGNNDIYAFNRIPKLKIEGTAYDTLTSTPIPHAIIALLDDNSKEIAL